MIGCTFEYLILNTYVIIDNIYLMLNVFIQGYLMVELLCDDFYHNANRFNLLPFSYLKESTSYLHINTGPKAGISRGGFVDMHRELRISRQGYLEQNPSI